MSLLNKVPEVPGVPDFLSTAQEPKCLSVQVPKSFECSCAQVPFECSSASNAQVPWMPERPSALRMPWVPECPSSGDCPTSARVPWVPKCFSKSSSHSAGQSAGLQCRFNKLISTLRAHTLRENLILRLRKLDLVSSCSLIKLKSLT